MKLVLKIKPPYCPLDHSYEKNTTNTSSAVRSKIGLVFGEVGVELMKPSFQLTDTKIHFT